MSEKIWRAVVVAGPGNLLCVFLLSYVLCTTGKAVAEESTLEEQVLAAAFVAFQPVDVFTAAEIRHSREVIFEAAAEGNEEAVAILGRLESFSDFYQKEPEKASIPVIKQVEIRRVKAPKSVFRGLITPE